ncbi:PREDICTED: uncharacterized protein LOC107068449 [Polistes dominula]|uniref:Uncharacterized protein LOC107068449 n=1 Tax=Polistes dominula TaxID=743375 RepID=A0ABM1IJC5_POLDO|nr:PREDICTED: uncharacterized protein LOC107068449 [Polistes dominula]
MEECDNYAVQTEDPCFQCVDIPAKMYTTLQDATTTVTDICTVCKKEKIPQTDIFQYSNIYKDNEGRICCDLCAPSHSNKIPIIINESKDILQKCSVCGNFPCIIDARSIGVVYKHDEKPSYCMKCGKLQS